MKLYFIPFACSLAARIALIEAELDADFVAVTPGGPARSGSASPSRARSSGGRRGCCWTSRRRRSTPRRRRRCRRVKSLSLFPPSVIRPLPSQYRSLTRSILLCSFCLPSLFLTPRPPRCPSPTITRGSQE